jgi:hypothetical protein
MKKWLILTITALFCLASGFLAGRKSIRREIKTVHVKGETLSGSMASFKPVKVEVPEIPLLPVTTEIIYRDTGSVVVRKVDTAAIIAEYEKKRFYSELLFDNNLGKLEIDLTTQYNKLSGLDYRFTPVHTVKTVEKKKIWTPFLSVSYNTLNHAGIGGGLFYHDIGLSVEYVTDFNRKWIDFGLLYKF